MGCYSETKRNRYFAITPGTYDSKNMNTTICLQQCGFWNYEFAIIAQSNICFCSDTLPSNIGTSKNICSGMSSSRNNRYVTIFQSFKPISDLRIVSSNPLISTFEFASFSISVKQRPSNVLYNFNFNDGSGWFLLDNKNIPVTWHFSIPGSYMITIEAYEATHAVTVMLYSCILQDKCCFVNESATACKAHKVIFIIYIYS